MQHVKVKYVLLMVFFDENINGMGKQGSLSFIFLILVSLLSWGCKAGNTNSDEDHFNGDSAGKFVITKEIERLDPSFYSKGCKVPNKSDPVYQVDADLKTGMNFTSFSAMKNPTKSYFMNYSETIQMVSPNYIASKLKVLEASGMGGIKKGMEFINTCKFTASGSEDCKLTPEPQTVNLSQECKIIDVISTELKKYYIGNFQFKNSATIVSSLKDAVRYKVHLRCPFYKGEGWVDVINIKSNQVPSTSANFCGGVILYTFYSIKKIDESVLNVAVTELLDFSN